MFSWPMLLGSSHSSHACEEDGCQDDETNVTEIRSTTEAGPKFITSKNSRHCEWHLVSEIEDQQMRISNLSSYLIHSHSDVLRFNLDQLGQRILKTSGDRNWKIFSLRFHSGIFTRISLYRTKGASYEINTCTTETDIEIWQLLLSLVWCTINRCSGFIDNATMFHSNTLQYARKKSAWTMQ